MKNNRKNDKIEFKIITIGDTIVGKTSIIRRYIENAFDEEIIQTVGIQKTKKKIKLKNGEEVFLNLCDTMGQERYKSMNKNYVRNADAVLLVFDLNNVKTFNNVKTWIDFLYDSNSGKENILKYLIGNKKDLPQEVENEKIELFLKEHKDFTYKATSAKIEDNQISELFQEMGEKLYRNYKKIDKKSMKKIKLRSGESGSSCCLTE